MMYVPAERITQPASSPICNCVFEFLKYKTGSAIFVSSQNWEMIIDRSLFRFCISNGTGGAINVLAKSMTFYKVCFDTCFIAFPSSALFGNAIYASSNAHDANAKGSFSSFFCCGPDLSISADSTIYFYKFPFSLSNMNFSECCGTDGPSTLSAESVSGELSFIEVRRGVTRHISCVFNEFSIQFSQSNFIEWNSYISDQIFWAIDGQTTLSSCCIFINNPEYPIGNNVIFMNNCFGNIDNKDVSKTGTVLVLLCKVYADNYCNNFQTQKSEKITSLVILMSIIFHPCAANIFMKTKYEKNN